MTALLPRFTAIDAQSALAAMPVVAVVGPRQAGKSQLATTPPIGTGRELLTLDAVDTMARLAEDPDGQLRRPGRFVVDEIQRMPSLMLALKRAVDAMGTQREMGKWVVTGSANLLLMEQVADSLAGRAAYVTLWPLTRRERLGQAATGRWDLLFSTPVTDWGAVLADDDAPREAWRTVVRHGGYPVPVLQLESDAARDAWCAGYIDSYLTRDLRDLRATQQVPELRRLLRAVAGRVGQVEQQAEIAAESGMPPTTVHAYLRLFEISYQLIRVPGYTASRTARLRKRPKLYWSDTAVGLRAADLDEPTGFHLENLVACDLTAWASRQPLRRGVFHWRTATQREVDFVLESREAIVGVEVKAARSVGWGDTAGLRAFLAEYPQRARGGVILYDGDDVQAVAEGIWAVPWWKVV